MAWLAPRTWVAGEVVTASLLNVNLRDQLAYLGENGSILSTPPALPRDGQLWIYPVDAANGIYWQFRFIAAAAAWVFVGGPPLTASNWNDSASTASTSYVDSSANAAITVPRAGTYLIEASGSAVATGGHARLSVFFGTTATDADQLFASVLNQDRGMGRHYTKVLAASAVVKFQHRSEAGGANTSLTKQLDLAVWPVKVT